jgi:hypothetical protein
VSRAYLSFAKYVSIIKEKNIAKWEKRNPLSEETLVRVAGYQQFSLL